jgi:hypothetical protein
MTITHLYRFEVDRKLHFEDYGKDFYSSSFPFLKLEKYPVTKETEKGFWIGKETWWYTDRSKKIIENWKWVSKTSRKRFAWPSKEEALEGYRQKKLAYVRHATKTLQKAKYELSLADRKICPV